MQIEQFLSQVMRWAEGQPDIAGVVLVGSHARGAARPDSDIDLVVLTTDPRRYLDDISFAQQFGPIARWVEEDWGRVTSLRVWYEDGMEVEYGFTQPDWAAPPLDAGTRRVIADGARVVFDRSGSVSRSISD